MKGTTTRRPSPRLPSHRSSAGPRPLPCAPMPPRPPPWTRSLTPTPACSRASRTTRRWCCPSSRPTLGCRPRRRRRRRRRWHRRLFLLLLLLLLLLLAPPLPLALRLPLRIPWLVRSPFPWAPPSISQGGGWKAPPPSWLRRRRRRGCPRRFRRRCRRRRRRR